MGPPGTLAAHDFEFISTDELVSRTARALGTMEKLERTRAISSTGTTP
jgi:hypothetical protein